MAIDNDFRARLSTEFTELKQKIDKLKRFILSGGDVDLDEQDRKDLHEQLKHMEAYFEVLLRRVGRLANNA
jgi:uncharacterized protein